MGFGFSSKKKKTPEPAIIPPSPSLPDLAQAQQRIPWPENLVDIEAVHAENYPSPLSDTGTPRGARKTSFHATHGPVPFHKPFKADPVPGSYTPQPNSIAALFGSGVPPPSSYTGVGLRPRTGSGSQNRSRRAKHAPTFNVMVAGARRTGKSSLLRLLLDTSTISPTNTQEQLASLLNYRSTSSGPTLGITSACIEILQTPLNRASSLDDRLALKCIDTPGLDFSEGQEFSLDRAVSRVVQYVDTQFAETMGEESKVIRTSKGDQHVHLCIYLIDPDSIMTPAARRAKSRLAAATFAGQAVSSTDHPEPSEYDSGSDDDEEGNGRENGLGDVSTTKEAQDEDSEDDYGPAEPAAHRQHPLTPISSGDRTPRNSVDPVSNGAKDAPVADIDVNRATVAPASGSLPPPPPLMSPQLQPQPQSQPRVSNRLSMNPAEIRVITRLAKRVNVLPIVARADTLTDGRLERIKRAVLRDLQRVSLSTDPEHGTDIFAVWDAEPGRNYKGPSTQNGAPVPAGHPEPEIEEERQSRPVIKLRERGSARGLTRSRSRKSLKAVVGAEYDEPDLEASPGYPVSPSSTHGHDGASLASPSRRTSVASAKGTEEGGVSTSHFQPQYGGMFSRSDLRGRMPFAIIAPERERNSDERKRSRAEGSQNGHVVQTPVYGRFVRRFRWGTIDVLDPQHCDFAALRAAVLGSYMKSLKASTKDVLYERFRTEKLLARRATASISDTDRKRIMQDLGL